MIVNRKVLILGILCLFVVPPILIWLLSAPLSSRFFDSFTPLRSIGQLCGLVGMSLFSLNFLLTARMRIFDKLFNGLNRTYIDHHMIGAFAFILLLMHPIALMLRFLSIFVASSTLFLFSAVTDVPILFGTISLLLMMVLLIFTFYIQLKYHIWKFSHKFLALAFAFGFLHMILIPSDVSLSILLRVYMVTLGIFSFIVIFYRTFFPHFFVESYSYTIENTKILTRDVIEITLKPIKEKMLYRAGQFAYFRFKNDKNISSEEHPFSITSNPSDELLKIVIKSLGDYTTRIATLKPGTFVSIEGPYGVFLKDDPKNQIWIAGGIGITPFLGKLASISSQSNIFMFYCVNTKEEALYLDIFQSIAEKNPQFRFISWFSKDEGYVTANKIKEVTGTLPNDFEINICGPAPLMANLRSQFVLLGIENKNIKSEEFSL